MAGERKLGEGGDSLLVFAYTPDMKSWKTHCLRIMVCNMPVVWYKNVTLHMFLPVYTALHFVLIRTRFVQYTLMCQIGVVLDNS